MAPHDPTAGDAPLILWFRRDLRIADNPMLTAALETGRPLIPVFVLDPETEALGAAPRWRLGLAVESFAERLKELGSRLILRHGDAAKALGKLAEDTGATGVWWTRLSDPAARKRDAAVARALDGARDFHGHTLHEPDAIRTGAGGYYKVYTPFWNAVRAIGAPAPAPSHRKLNPPAKWPESDKLADWRMGEAMNRGADVVARHVHVGEKAAAARLRRFLDERLDGYADARDDMGVQGTSGLSENLTYGEIGPRTLWHAGQQALEDGAKGAETFLREIVWRDFAHHLLFHTPHLESRNWREEWGDFPWRRDNADADAERWRRGTTGEPVVDAAMRELFVTGTMHNRARMIVASYLTKHLLTDWRVGQRWFAETLTDWDPASNALNWQWVAGSGPDAAPYFRIFNPATQAEKFDKKGTYRDRWLAEGRRKPQADALSFYEAIPRSWNMAPDDPPQGVLIGLKEGRERALAAYSKSRK